MISDIMSRVFEASENYNSHCIYEYVSTQCIHKWPYIGAVSYTHLDVYKRQEEGREYIEIPTKRPEPGRDIPKHDNHVIHTMKQN